MSRQGFVRWFHLSAASFSDAKVSLTMKHPLQKTKYASSLLLITGCDPQKGHSVSVAMVSPLLHRPAPDHGFNSGPICREAAFLLRIIISINSTCEENIAFDHALAQIKDFTFLALHMRIMGAAGGCNCPSYNINVPRLLVAGPDTIHTVPPATINAYHDHGDPKLRLEKISRKPAG